jgi:hypothetical protein
MAKPGFWKSIPLLLFVALFVALGIVWIRESRMFESDEAKVTRLLHMYNQGMGEKDAAQVEIREMGDRAKLILIRIMNDPATPYLEQGDAAWVLLMCFYSDSATVDAVEAFSLGLKAERDRRSMLSLVNLTREQARRQTENPAK